MPYNHEYSYKHKYDHKIRHKIRDVFYTRRLKLRNENDSLDVWPWEDALNQDPLHKFLGEEDVFWNYVFNSSIHLIFETFSFFQAYFVEIALFYACLIHKLIAV